VANRTGFSVVDAFPTNGNEAKHPARNEVGFLPFWDFTSKLHEVKTKQKDGTLFCYTPRVFYSLWRNIRNALDKYDTPQNSNVGLDRAVSK